MVGESIVKLAQYSTGLNKLKREISVVLGCVFSKTTAHPSQLYPTGNNIERKKKYAKPYVANISKY